MGWKNVKDHYQIKHGVQITDAGLCIGSPYMHDIIVISLEGQFIKRYQPDGWGCNANLSRYQAEMDADPDTLRRLIETPDTFAASKIVYTYERGTILEKLCEDYGWPNVTHDGLMMYDNTFSSDKAKVVEWAKRNAKAGIELACDRIAELESELEKARARRDTWESNLKTLYTEYPGDA